MIVDLNVLSVLMGDIIIGNMDSIQLLKWIVVLVIEGELVFAKSHQHVEAQT